MNPDIDSFGNVKYYTNIVTGQYFICNPLRPNSVTLYTPRERSPPTDDVKKSDANEQEDEKTMALIEHILSYYVNKKKAQSLANLENPLPQHLRIDHYNPLYEEHLLKQCIQWQQHLSMYRRKVSFIICNSKCMCPLWYALQYVTILLGSITLRVISFFCYTIQDPLVMPPLVVSCYRSSSYCFFFAMYYSTPNIQV